MEAPLQTTGHKLERASTREVFSREKWKILLPRTQPGHTSQALRYQREVFCQAAREEDARSVCALPVTSLLLLSHADG